MYSRGARMLARVVAIVSGCTGPDRRIDNLSERDQTYHDQYDEGAPDIHACLCSSLPGVRYYRLCGGSSYTSTANRTILVRSKNTARHNNLRAKAARGGDGKIDAAFTPLFYLPPACSLFGGLLLGDDLIRHGIISVMTGDAIPFSKNLRVTPVLEGGRKERNQSLFYLSFLSGDVIL